MKSEVLTASVGGLGLLLVPMLAVLGRLGPKLAVLGCSWGLCWRSWAVLGRKVALARAGRRSGKRIKAEKWLKPERERDLCGSGRI